MKFSSPSIKEFVLVLFVAFCFSSCNNEKQTVVDESIRLINKATALMQDINELEIKQLKEIPQDLQDSLALLQNRHPDVVLSEDDNRQIQMAMAGFTEAQENAIKVMSTRMDMLQQSIAKLKNGEDVQDDSLEENVESSYSYATFF